MNEQHVEWKRANPVNKICLHFEVLNKRARHHHYRHYYHYYSQ